MRTHVRKINFFRISEGALGKLVLKTAAATVSLIIAFGLILFGIVSLASPSAMMAFADSLAMDGLSAYYSIAIYERTGEISDLAAAVERSYDVEHYSDAAKYGEQLLSDSGFAAYCIERDEDTAGNAGVISSYKHYAAGIVSSAQYHSGEKESALNTALDALGQNTFPERNAMYYLSSAATSSGDVAFCREMLSSLEKLTVEDVQEQVLLQEFITDLQIFCAE